MHSNIESIFHAADGLVETTARIETALLTAMEADEVDVARLTRAFVRCSMAPEAADFRRLWRRIAVDGQSEVFKDFNNSTVRSVYGTEQHADLLLVRLAACALVFCRSESWFVLSAEASCLLRKLVDRTYIW